VKNNFCTVLPDGLVLPRGAPANFGSGELGEDWLTEDFEPGEIVYGVSRRVPPAYSVRFANTPVGSEVTVVVEGKSLAGTHWGDGIVLLDRDKSWILTRLLVCLILSLRLYTED